MTSKTQIANRALSKLGEPRISNIDTVDTKAANTIRYMYDEVRDALLTAYPWNFAMTRVQIAKDATAPAWGYNNRYQVPSDFLALYKIKNNQHYRIEKGYILTDEGAPLKILYIARIINSGEFDPLFVEAFASRLAYEACEEITQSNTKKQILAAETEQRIKEAYASDSIQDPPQRLQDDTWLIARESSMDEDPIDYDTVS